MIGFKQLKHKVLAEQSSSKPGWGARAANFAGRSIAAAAMTPMVGALGAMDIMMRGDKDPEVRKKRMKKRQKDPKIINLCRQLARALGKPFPTPYWFDLSEAELKRRIDKANRKGRLKRLNKAVDKKYPGARAMVKKLKKG